METEAADASGSDWTAASIGASVGFVAAYALCSYAKGGKDDQFERV